MLMSVIFKISNSDNEWIQFSLHSSAKLQNYKYHFHPPQHFSFLLFKLLKWLHQTHWSSRTSNLNLCRTPLVYPKPRAKTIGTQLRASCLWHRSIQVSTLFDYIRGIAANFYQNGYFHCYQRLAVERSTNDTTNRYHSLVLHGSQKDKEKRFSSLAPFQQSWATIPPGGRRPVLSV